MARNKIDPQLKAGLRKKKKKVLLSTKLKNKHGNQEILQRHKQLHRKTSEDLVHLTGHNT